MRGRPSLPLGKHGAVWTRKEGKQHTAYCYFRDLDGATRRVKATAPTAQGARNKLQDRLEQRSVQGSGIITRDSTVKDLAEAWYAQTATAQASHSEARPIRQSTRDQYRHKLDKHILPAMGQVRLREVTVGSVEGFLITKRGTPSIARICRQILSQMFAMAARADAVESNFIKDTSTISVAKKVKAMTVEDIDRFRTHIARWAGGDPAKQYVVDITDLFIATGLRPGELLALQWSDIDFKARTLSVTGTVKRDSVNGFHRQAYPKSEAGERTIVLPEFVWPMLARRKLVARGVPVFPARDGGWIENSAFNRIWNMARGEEWAGVQKRSFRTAVATLIARESGALAAAGQLGHSSDAVTLKYYVEKQRVTQDNSAVLGRVVNGERT